MSEILLLSLSRVLLLLCVYKTTDIIYRSYPTPPHPDPSPPETKGWGGTKTDNEKTGTGSERDAP